MFSLVAQLSDSPQAPSPLQILQAATHDRLMQSGNAAYQNLLLRNTSLEAEAQALRSAYTQLISSQSTSSSRLSKATHKVYQHEDYPNVTIWTAQDWQVHPKNKKNDEAGIHQVSTNQTSKKPNAPRASMYYIQKEDSSSVTEIEAGQICTQVRLVWEALHTRGIAPDRWGRMYAFRKYLWFGEGDWKAQRLAINTYPGWARGRGLLKGRVKTEAKEEPIGENLVGESIQHKTKKHKDPPTPTSTPKPEKLMKTPASLSTNTTTGTTMPVANTDGLFDVTIPSIDPMPLTQPAVGHPTALLSTIDITTLSVDPMPVTQPAVVPTAPLSTTDVTTASVDPMTVSTIAPMTPAVLAAPTSLSRPTSPLAKVDQVTTPVSPVLLPMGPSTTTSVTGTPITSKSTPASPLALVTTVENPLTHVVAIDSTSVVTTTLAMAAHVPDNIGNNATPPGLPSPIVTQTPPSPIQNVASDSSPLPVVELARVTASQPLKIKLKLLNPLSKSLVPVPASGEPGAERLSSASRVSSSDPTPAQPLSSNVVNTIPAATAAGPWFRFQPNSNSEINLFGRHFCKDSAQKVSCKEVTDVFNNLSEEKKTWADQRAENLTAKKERRKQGAGSYT
ncbi:uncharacterized protein LACBIDRAFT_332034 [Laccaria bicolor S238N-H82]|uniref:Predicted protein n=1 Tax=Laccaria bicolor (strain S238N-H82 / ATCC MYA-4686) TaxID=486041 RepID=B0DRC4_LACBS|nr:uncharacterized protein LACBIDRAFT_332034 [Laccaria bicolor S238N-H82]EDR02844.1 predicted protein [Laccaria bicolor S238N-H82]|eukprot:XP_001886554.1 predicted protein [Laccaria bicolor S238N-H82]